MLSLLRREREFRRLWSGLTVSLLGDQGTMLALPLAAAEAGRAVVLASVPIAFWLDQLAVRHLVAAAFALGSLSLLFQVSYSVCSSGARAGGGRARPGIEAPQG